MKCLAIRVYVLIFLQPPIQKLNFWGRNHNWILWGQELKEFLGKWINSKKNNFVGL